MINIKNAIIVALDEKGMLPVFGIPAIRRLVILALQIGVERIHIIGNANPLRSAVSDLLSPDAFHQLENPEQLEQVLDNIALSKQEQILVLKANHVVDQFSLRRLKDAITGPGLHFMGIKETADTDNIYVASTAHLVPLLRAIWSSDVSILKALEPAYRVEGVSGLPCVVEEGEDQIKIAENKLVAALGFQTKEQDGLLARHLDRKISRFLSKRLARTIVVPNQITLFGATIGLMGAYFLSRPGYWPALIGSLLFLFFAVIDGVDGEVARLKLKASDFGHYLDLTCDNIVHVVIFIALPLGLYNETNNHLFLYLLWFLIGGFGLSAISFYYNIARRSQEELEQSPKIIKLLALLANNDFAYLMVACALFRCLDWFLIAATVGAYVFAGTLWVIKPNKK